MTESKNDDTFNLRTIFLGVILIICALSLSIIALNLRPISKWAVYQSTCVEQESKKAPIEWAVRKCNGRSKVYQVK